MYDVAYWDKTWGEDLGLLKDYYDILIKEVEANKKRWRKDINNRILSNDVDWLANVSDAITNKPLIINNKIASWHYTVYPWEWIWDTPEDWLLKLKNDISNLKDARKNRDKITQPLAWFDKPLMILQEELKYCQSLSHDDLSKLIVHLNSERDNWIRTSSFKWYGE